MSAATAAPWDGLSTAQPSRTSARNRTGRGTAALATRRLDQVAVVDVEQDPLPFELDRPIDCIVVRRRPRAPARPWAVLGRQIEALADDGTVVICVPNMQHWSFADRLLRGHLEIRTGRPAGRDAPALVQPGNMREGLEAVGLVPHDVWPRIFDAEKAKEFATAIAPALHNLGVDPAAYARRAAPLQYRLAVVKRPLADAVGRFQHAGARRRRFACAHRVPDSGAAQTDPGVLTQIGVAEVNTPAPRYTAHLHSASPLLSGEAGRR